MVKDHEQGMCQFVLVRRYLILLWFFMLIDIARRVFHALRKAKIQKNGLTDQNKDVFVLQDISFNSF